MFCVCGMLQKGLWVVWRWSEAGAIPILNRKIPQSPVSPVGFDHSHSTPPSVPSLHSPRQLPVHLVNFQALAENWAIHAVRRQSDQSCPVTMSKTATTINYFVLENTHVALFIYICSTRVCFDYCNPKSTFKNCRDRMVVLFFISLGSNFRSSSQFSTHLNSTLFSVEDIWDDGL